MADCKTLDRIYVGADGDHSVQLVVAFSSRFSMGNSEMGKPADTAISLVAPSRNSASTLTKGKAFRPSIESSQEYD